MDSKFAFARIDQAELRVCRLLNRTSGMTAVRGLFRVVSWLGDGWIWYASIAGLPFFYPNGGWVASVHMTLSGAVGLLIYKAIKLRAVRERPYITHSSVISCASVPLDQYSFPSGHTLHAVSFSLVLAHYFPEWAALLLAFTVLVALSRVVLGLHYPSDVAAGAVLGGAVGFGSLSIAELLITTA
jgi:undecaprenyl-diphosphatase